MQGSRPVSSTSACYKPPLWLAFAKLSAQKLVDFAEAVLEVLTVQVRETDALQLGPDGRLELPGPPAAITGRFCWRGTSA